jgi:hypothetical protein
VLPLLLLPLPPAERCQLPPPLLPLLLPLLLLLLLLGGYRPELL